MVVVGYFFIQKNKLTEVCALKIVPTNFKTRLEIKKGNK